MTNLKLLENRLRGLPLRGLAALAARCARRVEPLTASLNEKWREGVPQAISFAESFAYGLNVVKPVTLASDDPTAIDTGAEAARAAAATAANAADTAAAASANDVVRAAAAAVAAIANSSDAYEYALSVTGSANLFETKMVNPDETSIIFAIKKDVDRLEFLFAGERNTIGSPLDTSETGLLGLLWPNGSPHWFHNPQRASSIISAYNSSIPSLTFYFNPVEFSEEDMAAILVYFSDLYRSIGGDALIIDRTESLDPSLIFSPKEA